MADYDFFLKSLVEHEHEASEISDGNDTWVNVSGDSMTGDLNMGTNYIILRDSNGVDWALTVSTDGALITSLYSQTFSGKPMGLMLSITYP